jgi:hypothetical protein
MRAYGTSEYTLEAAVNRKNVEMVELLLQDSSLLGGYLDTPC